MSRTMFNNAGGAKVDNIKAGRDRMADPMWAAPRISAADISKYVGYDITLVGEATSLDFATGTATLTCVVSQKSFDVVGIPPQPHGDMSKLNEITCNVTDVGQPLVYASHGMLNDDFDTAVYAQTVHLINTHHRDLFFPSNH